MFKNSLDESTFCKVLNTYIAEFGPASIVLHLPRSVADSMDQETLAKLNVKFWKKNEYGITVKDMTANYTLKPQE